MARVRRCDPPLRTRVSRRTLACGLTLVLISGACTGVADAPPTTTIPPPPDEPLVISGGLSGARYDQTPVNVMQLSPRATVTSDTSIESGQIEVSFSAGELIVRPAWSSESLRVRLPGQEVNLLADATMVSTERTEEGATISMTGSNAWAVFSATASVFDGAPDLVRWTLDVQPAAEYKASSPGLDVQLSADLPFTVLVDRAPMAAPQIMVESKGLDATVLYWEDLTSLNAFHQVARVTPASTPTRERNRFGSRLDSSDLRQIPVGMTVRIVDSFAVITRGVSLDEAALTDRYVGAVATVYRRISKPRDPLPDWFAVGALGPLNNDQGIQDLAIESLLDVDAWVTIDEKPYLRAYWGDTRESAEAITQLDVLSALLRYDSRSPTSELIISRLRQTIPDFFEPTIGPRGMFVNSGPIGSVPPQQRGDTWYELGHAIKVAEIALRTGDIELTRYARDSADTWINFAEFFDYEFPQFYRFARPPDITWSGTGREPDAAGGYAYLMLLVQDLTGDVRYGKQAERSLLSISGRDYLFGYAYETHMTAATLLAAMRLYARTDDPRFLDPFNLALANLLRLSWIWEADYGHMLDETDPEWLSDEWWNLAPRRRTFFGLSPTQRGAVITPKEQYEAWLLVAETLRVGRGKLSPDVELLLSEFYAQTLITTPTALPPLLDVESVTTNPRAYPTVQSTNPALWIPLEDMRDGWDLHGAIGQQIYGGGMPIAMAAESVVEVAPGALVYSSYPVVALAAETFTVAGLPSTFAMIRTTGIDVVSPVLTGDRAPVACGTALCFVVPGGTTVQFRLRAGAP